MVFANGSQKSTKVLRFLRHREPLGYIILMKELNMPKLRPVFYAVLLLIGVTLNLGATAKRRPSSSFLGASAVYELPDPKQYSAIYAVSDVHGMSAEIIKILTAAKVIDPSGHWIAGTSLLIVVGDSIDKGPDSIGVVDLWRSLAPQASKAGGALVHLLGNHEAELLADPSTHLSSTLAQELQAKGLSVNDLVDPTTPRGAYLHSEPLAAKIGSWLFCHAGLYPAMPWGDFRAKAAEVLSEGAYGDPFILGTDSILEAKNWWGKKATRNAVLRVLNQNGFIGLVQGVAARGLESDSSAEVSQAGATRNESIARPVGDLG